MTSKPLPRPSHLAQLYRITANIRMCFLHAPPISLLDLMQAVGLVRIEPQGLEMLAPDALFERRLLWLLFLPANPVARTVAAL